MKKACRGTFWKWGGDIDTATVTGPPITKEEVRGCFICCMYIIITNHKFLDKMKKEREIFS